MSDAAETTDNPLVVCDANIFYAIVTTDLILSLGVAELFRPRWTNQIHDEWMRNLLANRPNLDPTKIERRRQQMDEAIDDCLVEGYEYLVPELNLPDHDDCHVLAAAIHVQAQVILTYNQRHFPQQGLAPYGITAQHPDDFWAALVERFSQAVCETLEAMRARKTRPPLSRAEILRTLEHQQLPKFVAALRATGHGTAQ
jgi:predicted nucleic acid-binding protein